jgi:agmatinase
LEVGDLDLSDTTTAFAKIEASVTKLLDHETRVLSLGGDHSLTLPILRAFSKKFPKLTVMQLDAHPDLYDELDGNRYSHATPMLRALEEGLMTRLVQLGIRSATPDQRARAQQYHVETIEMRNWQPVCTFDFDTPVYLSLCIDCLDPACAPGVSHPEPGGFFTRDLLQLVQNLKANIVGAEIVEFNPKRDQSGLTAIVAAKFVKEIAGKLLA